MVDLPDTALAADRRVIEARGLSVAFDGAPLWAAPLDLAVTGPERVAVTGDNGTGKSTLLRLLAGVPAPGAVVAGRLACALAPAFLDQCASVLNRADSVLDNMAAHAPHLSVPERRQRLGRFLFEQERALVPVAALSGGERMRAALCCLFARREPPRVLVLDEPTNHLDLDGVAALESALAGFRGALVVASHDARFLDALGVTRRVALARS